ncbi:MAG: 3-oxoacyl-[acyl-carrier-protein] reductase [Eubacteriales bacterium]|nr:3-oxoacyl-[acyl-carrier-protein] reductase [Eubacteriales bacterium]MDD3882113.1 3-oxoacyl-[acyl-carrier-protein] reductase [Eubacteriales bacterium]MDD4513218.1 3-oxoacyl-[acyl-carrier-protein] reductase [Eubacteriales bacterium]
MLNGKTALITGFSRGIGRAASLELAARGANIAGVYFGNDAAAEETLALLAKAGVKAISYKADVSDFAACEALAKQAIQDFGSVEILVNNAGMTKDGLCMRMSDSDFSRVIDVDLKGAFNMIRHLSGHMLRRREGRIINIASVAGMMGNAGQANYSAAKAGLIGLTKTVARELGSRGITVNAVAPGLVKTDMTASLPQEKLAEFVKTIPLGRMAEPEDVAKTIAFLADEDSAYITGQVIKVDGGLYI